MRTLFIILISLLSIGIFAQEKPKTNITGSIDATGRITADTIAYAIFVQADGNDPTDGTTVYFCSTPQQPATNEINRRVVILKSGHITAADIVMNTTAGNAGSNEDISIYIRKNATTDYLIETIGSTDGAREFNNYSLNIPVTQGDIIVIKVVNPTWATEPTNVNWSGNFLVE
jgi:hypothetical protein